MRQISICVVGAGGSYTPEIVEGVLARTPEQLPLAELSFVDTNEQRLDVMTGLARRMIAAADRELHVRSSRELAEGAAGADFVITQVRIGGMGARRLDETIPAKYGVIGQETTGPGGMFKALRTIPIMVEIARTVAEVAPDAVILNYTNPSGVVTEAVLNHTRARLFGLCSSIPLTQAWIQRQLADQLGALEMYSVGLNHLGFVHRIVSHGKDVTETALEALRARGSRDPVMASALEMSRVLGAFPVPKYGDYYFHRGREVHAQAAAKATRAERVMEIEAQVLAEAADPALCAKPVTLAARGGAGYSGVTLDALDAVLNNRPTHIVMSTLNRGAITGLPDGASVELTCRVDAAGATPLPQGELPLAVRGLVQAVKAHESLTVEAALSRRRDVALQALLAHPLIGDIDVAEPMLDELLTAHGLDYQ